MAGKTLSKDDLKAAVEAYAAANGKQVSEGDTGKFTIFSGTPRPGDAMVWLEDGQLRGNDIDFCLNFAEEFIKGPKETIKSLEGINTLAKAKSPGNGQMVASRGRTPHSVQAIQAMQAGRDLTYEVNKQKAPTANLALMAATDAGVVLEEVAREHTDGFVSSTVRATAPDGRYVEATVSLIKQDFINLLAWKIVQEQEALENFILDDSDPLNIALPNGFPRLKPEATIKVRIKDKTKSILVQRKAITEIYINIMRQWIFQQRQCQTKAKRNAIIQLLTSSGQPMQTMEPEELADEQMEVDLVEVAA